MASWAARFKAWWLYASRDESRTSRWRGHLEEGALDHRLTSALGLALLRTGPRPPACEVSVPAGP